MSSSTSAAAAEERKHSTENGKGATATDLGLLEEDDDFEEFPAEGEGERAGSGDVCQDIYSATFTLL